MQYKVPQNVDIEDKVIGGLTLRQFAFLMGAGAVILAMKYLLPSALGFVFMPLAILIGGFGLALAFYKINDRPLEIFLISAVKTLLTPNQRVWRREGEIEKPAEDIVKQQPSYQPKKNLKEIRSSLEQLATAVDSGSDIIDGHVSNISKVGGQDLPQITDILDKTERPSEKLDEFIADAKAQIKPLKEEMPISSLASVNASENTFHYENLELKNEEEMKAMLEAANQKQKETEETLKEAKIKKFE